MVAFLSLFQKLEDEFFSVDPYAKVSFESNCQLTRVIKQTVCPEWDQTLIFEEIQMYGTPMMISECPPVVNIEIFDKDQVVWMFSILQPDVLL